MNKYLLLDFVNSGNSHYYFNTTTITALLVSDRKAELIVCLAYSQINLMKHELREYETRIKWVTRYTSKYKAIENVKNYILARDLINKNDVSAVVNLAVDNLVYPMGKLLFVFRKNNYPPEFVIFHNNIESLRKSKLKTVIWARVFKKKITPIVLADFVQDEAKNLFSCEEFPVLHHPTYKRLPIITEIISSSEQCNDKKYDFILLGRHSSIGNSYIASSIESVSKTRTHKISVCARQGISYFSGKNFTFIGYEHPLSNESYWMVLKKSKFLIIPPESGGRITASGVLADAITLGVPIIAPRHGVFKEFIPKSNYKLLYDENIENSISVAMNMDYDEYEELSKDVLKHADKYDLATYGSQLLNIANIKVIKS